MLIGSCMIETHLDEGSNFNQVFRVTGKHPFLFSIQIFIILLKTSLILPIALSANLLAAYSLRQLKPPRRKLPQSCSFAVMLTPSPHSLQQWQHQTCDLVSSIGTNHHLLFYSLLISSISSDLLPLACKHTSDVFI